jgi:flagellar biosynthesis protein FliR
VNIPLGVVLEGIDVFLLIFVRMTGMFVVAPIFGRRNIPNYFKVGLAFVLSVLLINALPMPKLESYDSIWGYGLLIGKEFLVGITLGFVAYLVYTGIYIAGQLIDMQIGFGMVNVFDPMSNIQVPVTANLYFMISMLIFLMVNGHHMVIKALVESYRFIPVGGAVFHGVMVEDIIRVFSNIFLTGIKIAAPITAAILVVDVALGVISKAVPQINVFVLGMPLKITLGIIVMIITIPVFISFVDVLRDDMNAEMFKFIKDMGSAK